MTTVEDIETSLRNAAVAYSHRSSGKLSAVGCVIYVDVYDKVQVTPERDDADPDRIQRALRYH